MNRLAALLPARLLTPTLTPEHLPAGARPSAASPQPAAAGSRARPLSPSRHSSY
jgi:hypothetical protein